MDVGDVLIRTAPMAQYRALARHTLLPWEHVAATLEDSGIVTEFETGRLAPAEFTAAICDRLRQPELHHRDVRNAWDAVVADVEPTLARRARKLSVSGRLVLASNTNPFHWEVVHDRLAASGINAPAYLSFRIGHVKPSPRFFAELASGEPRIAQGAVYIDDREDSVAEAVTLGMTGFLHRNVDSTAIFLDDLLT
jgi:putative hydrolase of the HAD superfamily